MTNSELEKIYPAKFRLLEKEIEAQGDLLNQERVERKSEIDSLRLELQVMKQLLERVKPGSLVEYEELFAEARRTWNPELQKPELMKKEA